MKMYHEINSLSSVRTLLTKPHLPVVNSVSWDQHWRAVHLIYSTDLSDSCAALSFHSSLFLTLCLLWQSYDLPRLSYCFSPVPAPCYICYSTRKDINTHPCSIMHTFVFSMGLSSLWHPWDSFFFLSFSYRVMVLYVQWGLAAVWTRVNRCCANMPDLKNVEIKEINFSYFCFIGNWIWIHYLDRTRTIFALNKTECVLNKYKHRYEQGGTVV